MQNKIYIEGNECHLKQFVSEIKFKGIRNFLFSYNTKLEKQIINDSELKNIPLSNNLLVSYSILKNKVLIQFNVSDEYKAAHVDLLFCLSRQWKELEFNYLFKEKNVPFCGQLKCKNEELISFFKWDNKEDILVDFQDYLFFLEFYNQESISDNPDLSVSFLKSCVTENSGYNYISELYLIEVNTIKKYLEIELIPLVADLSYMKNTVTMRSGKPYTIGNFGWKKSIDDNLLHAIDEVFDDVLLNYYLKIVPNNFSCDSYIYKYG